MKPVEFDDFSGGVTDKDVPGKTNRCSVADNFLIDYDKTLLQRDGFDIVSSTAYQLAAAERVSRLVNFDIDSEVLAFQNKKAFAIAAGAWTEVVGPGGGSATTKAFNTNTAASLLEETQWQHHLFAASDSGDPVIKMFRDSGGTMRLRTAGLPEFTSALTPTDGGLALAITLVNAIQTKMIAHFGSNGAAAGTPNNVSTKHHIADAGGLLAAQATAVATGTVPAATDLTSLITLLNALRVQYGLHIADAQGEDKSPVPNPSAVYGPNRKYHMAPNPAGFNANAYDPFIAFSATVGTGNQPLYLYRHYLNFTLEDPAFSVPSSAVIADVLPYLNDLRDKWNWHTYASMTHYNSAYWQGSSNFTNLGLHATSVARVAPYTWAAITPNYGPFLQFVIDLKTEYDAHRLNDMHIEDDTVWVVPSGVSATPTTFQDGVTLLGWLAHCITYHALEPDTNFCANGNTIGDARTRGDVASGAATLTFQVAGAHVADLYKNLRVAPLVNVTSTLWQLYICQSQTLLYNVTGSSTADPAVLTCANNFTASETDKGFLITARHFHFGQASAQLFNHRALAETFDSQDFLLQSASSLQGFSDLATSLAGYLKAHTIQRLTVNPATTNNTIKINSKEYSTYAATTTSSAVGYDVLVHAGQDNTNFPTVIGVGGLYVALNSSLLSANTPATQLAEDRFLLAPEAASFLYKMVFKYDYTVGTVSFTDRSAPSTAITAIGFLNADSGSSTGATEIGKFAATFANIQVYANAANENYAHTDTTNFRKEVYRTLGNGTRYYKTDVNDIGGDIPNATTSYFDVSTDTYLVDQLELYTNDGVPENNIPPVATSVHVFGNVMFYVKGNKVFQSIPNDLDSVPSDFFEEFEENVVAISSTRSVAVAFTPTKVSRLTGGFDSLGRGSLGHDIIFDRTGAISAPSVVKADNGIFFAGKDGFYFTDGYQCMRVTDLEKTFRTYTNTAAKRNSIQGTYDNISKRVYWTVTTAGGSAPDKIWVLDLQFGIKPDVTPITTLSKTTGFNPTALTYFNGQIYYGDNDGYTFVQTRGLNMDLVKDTGVAATSWAKETTQWDFKGCHYDYGTQAVRKYFTRAGARFDMQSTNVSAQIVSDADKGRIISNLPVIRSRKLTDWGDSKIDWVSTPYPAKAGNLVDEWRWFKGDGSLRSNFRAVEIKTAYCVIVASKDMGTVTISNVAGNVYTVTLTSLVATRKWPLYSVGYFVRINSVDYPVTVRTSDSVVRIDSTGLTSPSTGVSSSWELYGYPKNEKIRLIGYGVSVDLEDEQQTHSEGPIVSAGTNA